MAFGDRSPLGPRPAALRGQGGPSLHMQCHIQKCCEDKEKGMWSPQTVLAPGERSALPASFLTQGVPWSHFVLSSSISSGVGGTKNLQRPYTGTWCSVTLVFGRAVPPSLKILINSLSHSPASFLLCSFSPGSTTHSPSHPTPQCLPPIDPAPSSVMWFSELNCWYFVCCVHSVYIRAHSLELLLHGCAQY